MKAHCITRDFADGKTAADYADYTLVYESAVGQADTISDPDGQVPLGVVCGIGDRLTIVDFGPTFLIPDADIDIAAQLGDHGLRAVSSGTGKGAAPSAAGDYYAGRWDTKQGAPKAGVPHKFFVNVTGLTVPA